MYNDHASVTPTNTFSLYFSTSSDPSAGTWTKITESTDTFRLSTTSQYDEGTAPTDLLSNSGSLTHGTGYLIESSDEHTFSLTYNTSFEWEYCVMADAKAIGATYYFAIKFSSGSDIMSHGSLPGLTITKYDQIITFAELPNKTIDDTDFDPGATSDFGLDITYESSDELVATIVDDQIHIVGAGTTNITATQAGNDTVNVANPVVQSLIVTKATGLNNLGFANLKIYPNPAKNIVNVGLGDISASNNVRISIIDLTGKILLSKILIDNNNKIRVEDYDSGLYFVEIKNTTERRVLKLVIE
jgi:type IX secretion system substrate protein